MESVSLQEAGLNINKEATGQVVGRAVKFIRKLTKRRKKQLGALINKIADFPLESKSRMWIYVGWNSGEARNCLQIVPQVPRGRTKEEKVLMEQKKKELEANCKELTSEIDWILISYVGWKMIKELDEVKLAEELEELGREQETRQPKQTMLSDFWE